MIFAFFAYETYFLVVKVRWQIDECSTFLQDMSVYFLAEYSDDILYEERFGWNIFFKTLERLYTMRKFLTVFICMYFI
jgi:hypothetical protein